MRILSCLAVAASLSVAPCASAQVVGGAPAEPDSLAPKPAEDPGADTGTEAAAEQATPAEEAPEDTSATVEEIIVTAQKRAQNLQEVSVSAQTLTAKQLEDSGVTDLVDLPQISSSFNLIDLGYAQPFIRGIGSTVAGTGFYSTVSSYVDGVYIARTNSLNSGAGGINDAESVVVLRGPQGSLYGRNATGGAVVITTHTPRPGDPIASELRAGYGNYKTRALSGKISGGINDVAAFSLAASYDKNDGFIKDLSDGSRGDDTDSHSFAGKLTLAPSENVDVVLSGKYSSALERFGLFNQFATEEFPGAIPGLNAPQTLYAGTAIAFGVPSQDAIAAASNLRFGKGHKTYDNERNGFTNGLLDGKHLDKSFTYNRDILLSANTRVKLDTFDVVSITSFNDNRYNSAADVLVADASSVPSFGLGAPNIGFAAKFKSQAFSQDLQLVSKDSPVEWITGVSYFNENGPVLQTGDAFGTSSLIADDDWKVEALSGFGEVSVPVEKFKFTVGGRYNTETYKIDDHINSPGNVGHIDREDNKFSYSLRADYQGDNTLTYAAISTGIKSGSLNPNNPSAGSASPEEITSYEIGFKSEFADRRVRLNGAAFYYDYQNIQLNVLVPGNGSTFLVNGSNARVLGGELELVTRPVPRLGLFANLTALDTEYKDDATFTIGNDVGVLPIKGKKLVAAPDLAMSIGFDWTMPYVQRGDLTLNSSLRYSSGYWIDSENRFGTGGVDDDAFATVNASLAYTDPSEKWTLTGWIENAFDEFYVPSGLAAAGGLTQAGTVGRPRQFGLRVAYKF